MKHETCIIIKLVDQLNNLYLSVGHSFSAVSSFVIQVRVLGTGTSVSRFVFQLCAFDNRHLVVIQEFDNISSLLSYVKEHSLPFNYPKNFISWIKLNSLNS